MMEVSKISPEALAEVNAAFERYEEAFEQAIAIGTYKRNSWESDYRPCAQYFVDWLNGKSNPLEGRRRRPRVGR